jgi:hypothetical protein
LVNNSLLNSNINNDILDIKETATIPVNSKIISINNNEKSISPINKLEKYINTSTNKNEIIKINNNNNNITQNNNNYQKPISKNDNKNEKEKEKEEKDDGLNFSMMKIFEQLIKKDSERSKTIKKIGIKNEHKAFEKKNTQIKLEFKKNFGKKKSTIEENIIKEYTEKLLNTPGVKLTKEEIMEEVDNIKKEMIKSKNLSVKSKTSSKKKKIITKAGLNELKEKLVLINNVDQMNLNKEQKEEFLILFHPIL